MVEGLDLIKQVRDEDGIAIININNESLDETIANNLSFLKKFFKRVNFEIIEERNNSITFFSKEKNVTASVGVNESVERQNAVEVSIEISEKNSKTDFDMKLLKNLIPEYRNNIIDKVVKQDS